MLEDACLNGTNSILETSECSLKTEWLTSEEAASYLRVSVKSLFNLCSNGQLTYYKFKKRNRYKRSELEALLLSNKRGGFNGN